jgi:WD40 repeat protein
MKSLGLVVSGSQDKTIHVFDPLSPADEPLFILTGHTDNVSALNVSKSNNDLLVSGSWDK